MKKNFNILTHDKKTKKLFIDSIFLSLSQIMTKNNIDGSTNNPVINAYMGKKLFALTNIQIIAKYI